MSPKQKKKRSKKQKQAKPEPKPAELDSVLVIIENLIFSITLLILFLRPFVSGRTYPQYNHFFHIAVAILTILWLLKCMRVGKLELHNRLLTGFVLAFLFVCSLTLITTVSKGTTLRYTYEILSYTLLFLVIANNFREGASIKAAIATVIFAGFLINCYGLYQHYYSLEITRRHVESVMAAGATNGLMGLPLNTAILHRLESQRVFATFLYPNTYGMFLGFYGALTIGFFWSMRDSMKEFARASWNRVRLSFSSEPSEDSTKISAGAMALKISLGVGGLLLLAIFAASCILIPWNLWLTYSRGGWVSAIVIILVIAAVWTGGRLFPGKRTTAALLAAIVLCAIIFPTNVFSADAIPAREVSLMERLGDMGGIKQRITYWKASLNIVRDYPWLGIGWGAFEKAYSRYMILGGYPVKLAHNNYLQVWAETGTIGLNAFVGIWIVFLYTFWRKIRSTAGSEMFGVTCGLGAALIGFVANNVFDFGLYLPTMAYYIFAMLGLVAAIPEDAGEEKKFLFRLPKPVAAILIAALCVYIFSLYNSFMGLLFANRVDRMRNTAFPTEYAVQKGFKIDPMFQRRILRECIPLLKKSISHFPLDATSHHVLGDTYLRLANMESAPNLLENAMEPLQRATELDTMAAYPFQSLAMAYWTAGNALQKPELFEKSLQAMLKASENFPVNPGFHEKLAQMYNSLDMKEKSEKHKRLQQELKKHYKLF